MKLPRRLKLFTLHFSLFTFICAASAAQFDLDPYSFREESPGTYRSFGTALCVAAEPAAPSLTLHARVSPERCNCPNWAALGINAYISPNDYWQLAIVKSPGNAGSKHRYELKAKVDSVWGGEKDAATRLEQKTLAPWEYGREYDFTLSCTPKRVDGEIRDAESGKVVFRASFAPNARDQGRSSPRERPLFRPGIYVNGELHGTITAVEATAPDNPAPTTSDGLAPGAPDLTPPDGLAPSAPDSTASYGLAPGAPAPGRASLRERPFIPSGPETGLRGTATGFFHMETIDGRDWPIDPTGRAVILAGTQHIKPWGTHSDALGYSPYGRFVATNYPSVSAWADETLARLSDWGFTFLGNACAIGLLGHKALPHVQNLQMGQRVCRGDPEWYIREWNFAPCQALPNVFHPLFAAACEWRARERCAPFKDDPWLVGWFIDNELAWWGTSKKSGATGLFDRVMALPPTHSARQELNRFIAAAGVLQEGASAPSDVKVAFLRHYARTYYEKTTAAIRKADPNHMVMGSRYAGIDGAHPVVWEEAGRCCDIVTFNCYPWADLDRGIVLDKKDGVPMTERLREYHGYAKKPLMVTEWSFPAIDNGHPCLVGAGQRFRTQDERVEATTLFARTLLADPHVAGYDYFKWADQPRQGASRWNPEDCNYGLVDELGIPYPGITSAFKELHGNLLHWRTAPPPEERPCAPPAAPRSAPPPEGRPCAPAVQTAGLSERERYLATAGVLQGGATTPPVHVILEKGAYTLDNGLVRISGRIGSQFMADEIAFANGQPLGRIGALLAAIDNGTNVWQDISRLTDSTVSRDNATGIASVTLRGEGFASGPTASDRADLREKPFAFAITLRLTLAPGASEALAEIAAFENIGSKPIEMRSLFIRAFSTETSPVSAIPPNLWKAPNEAAWRIPGGGMWGLASEDATANPFKFWFRSIDNSQHPDAPFSSSEKPLAIVPGETWLPPTPMSARIFRR